MLTGESVYNGLATLVREGAAADAVVVIVMRRDAEELAAGNGGKA